MLKKLTQRLETASFGKYIVRLLAAFCMSSLFFFISGGAELSIVHAANTNVMLFVIVFALFYAAVWLIGVIVRNDKTEPVLLVSSFFAYAAATMFVSDSWYYSFGMAACGAVIVFYLIKKEYLKISGGISSVKKWVGVAVIFAVFVLISGGISVYRYKSYSTPNYDFGIFCNMFYNMRKTLMPFTTCERDRLLSHFAVHVSPIFYVLLPLYGIFSSPSTLALSQSLILASAVIPTLLIAKKYELSNSRTLIVCFIALFHPAIICGTNYDLHENCFLFPLLLWVFYCFETSKYGLLAFFTVLTLMVKEDAAIYIIFFALYVLIGRRRISVAAFLAAGALVYFFAALLFLSKYGDGVMSGRYGNYLPNGGSLIDVVKNILIEPGYVFTQLFVDSDGNYAAKILFMLQILAPFAFMPFAVRRVSELLLILPMILLNLMPVYVYQYDIGFQYHFGVMAFMVYLCIINISQMEKPTSKMFLGVGAAVTALLFIFVAFPRVARYCNRYFDDRQMYAVMDEALEAIPEDASVICSTFLLPKLSEREVIYEDFYHKSSSDEDIDYVILDMRFNYMEYEDIYTELGYTDKRRVSFEDRDILLIMQKPAEAK